MKSQLRCSSIGMIVLTVLVAIKFSGPQVVGDDVASKVMGSIPCDTTNGFDSTYNCPQKPGRVCTKKYSKCIFNGTVRVLLCLPAGGDDPCSSIDCFEFHSDTVTGDCT